MSYSGIQPHVLKLWANNFRVLGLLRAESLVSVAETQDTWREDTALPVSLAISASPCEPAHSQNGHGASQPSRGLTPSCDSFLKGWHDGSHMSAITHTEVLQPCLTTEASSVFSDISKVAAGRNNILQNNYFFSSNLQDSKSLSQLKCNCMFLIILFWFRQRWPVEGGVICSIPSCAVHPVVSSLDFLNFLCPHQCPKLGWPWKELSLK